ncbi:MAG: hypothetical protein II785_04170, partial [Lachnospiraceae bacterium]|nr:hypothetical protein [Lachnospiraceae bacterium]
MQKQLNKNKMPRDYSLGIFCDVIIGEKAMYYFGLWYVTGCISVSPGIYTAAYCSPDVTDS